MTKSGTQCEGNENRKSQKPFIFANWTILSIFEKNFFWIIQKFQKPNLASKKIFLGSSFFPDLKFSPVVPNLPNYQKKIIRTKSLDKKFTKKLTEWSKKQFFLKFWIIQYFFRKKGSVGTLRISISNFWPKISKILRAVTEIWCGRTDRPTFPGLTSTEVENYRSDSMGPASTKSQVQKPNLAIDPATSAQSVSLISKRLLICKVKVLRMSKSPSFISI